MHKLNNNGWGLNVMIAFTCIFIFCLLLSAFLINRIGIFGQANSLNPLYSSTTTNNSNINNSNKNTSFWDTLFNSNDTTDYGSMQVFLLSSAKRYVNDAYNNQLGIDTLIITVSNLKSKNYITQFQDSNGRACTGYVEASYGTNKEIEWKTFIKCKKYETVGYEERKDVK